MTPLVLDGSSIGTLIASFLWPFFRLSALFAVMPVLGGAEVPMRVRVGLAVAITLLILPVLPPSPEVDALSFASLIITLQELMIGIAMGLMINVIFNAVTLGGESVAITMGLGFALMNDPQNGVSVPSVSQFYLILATLLFLSLNGHHAALELVVSSFESLPVGVALGPDAMWQLVSWGAIMFRGALSVALPALAAMLTVNILMGVMTRAAPQMNIFSVGFPLTMTVGFIAIGLTLPSFGEGFQALVVELFGALRQLVGL